MIKILIQIVTIAHKGTQNPSFKKIVMGKLENEAGNVKHTSKENPKRADTANDISKAKRFGWIVYWLIGNIIAVQCSVWWWCSCSLHDKILALNKPDLKFHYFSQKIQIFCVQNYVKKNTKLNPPPYFELQKGLSSIKCKTFQVNNFNGTETMNKIWRNNYFESQKGQN